MTFFDLLRSLGAALGAVGILALLVIVAIGFVVLISFLVGAAQT